MKRVTLAHLRVFCEVADCLSITVAANRLFRTQPAVSRQLAELQADFGVALFVKQGRGLALTSEGKSLHAHSRDLLASANELSTRAQELAAGSTGTLRIGAMTASLEGVLPHFLATYRAQWPQVVVRFMDVDTRDLLGQVESGELDLAFGRDVASDAVAAQRLFPMQLLALVPRSHALSKRTAIEVRDLERAPLLLTPAGTGSRVLLAQVCTAEGFALRDVRLESRAYSALASMAAAGCGIAVVLSSIDKPPAGVRALPIHHNGKALGVWFSAIWHRRRRLPPYAQAFVETARLSASHHFPGKQFDFPTPRG